MRDDDIDIGIDIGTELPERLATAADQAVITAVPTAAVLRRARRRRRGRRLASGSAVLAAGGLLAAGLAALPQGGQERPAAIVVPPGSATPAPAGVTRPSNAVLGEGEAGGYRFRVELDVWAAAADEEDVWRQVRAMYESDTELPFEVETGANYPPVRGEDELPYGPGTSWYYVYLSVDGNPRAAYMQGEVRGGSRDEIRVSGTNLDGNGNESPDAEETTVELIFGHVPEGVERAEIVWENDTVSEPELVEGAGAPGGWFTAAGPEGGVDPVELRTYDGRGRPGPGYAFNGW
ncbi:hypothetical protein [Streptomyces sp. MAR4 CNX-425]|uniref:hypothetical protein n=1 Tax=Streptomyces sp. MAR4 CNX-425 TaxID=3406343 RepID=UPI003B514797